MKIELEELTERQLEPYKALILSGLTIDENCFRIAPEDEKMESFPTTGEADNFTIGAHHNSKLIGVASFKRDGKNRIKLRHKGILFKIYVDPKYRRQGVAGKLIQCILDRVYLIQDIEQINLTVIPTNKHAKNLYQKFGFENYASEPKAVKWKGKYFSEDQMKLIMK